MKDMLDCITVGTSVLDTFVQLKTVHHHASIERAGAEDQCFTLGAKMDAKRIVQQSGGGGSNAAATFVRQRLHTAILSKVGDDMAGRLVLNELEENNIQTQLIHRVRGAKTAQSVILIDPSADRTVLLDKGTVNEWIEKDIEALHPVRSRWVYLSSLHGSPMALSAVFEWAEQNSVKVAWNPGVADFQGVRSRLHGWLSQCSLLLLNREEAGKLVDDQGSVDVLSSKVHALGVKRAVISDGANTLGVVEGNEISTYEPAEIDAVDQTGAGDALGSGIVACLLRGETFREAVKFGLTNAEHVILHVGAKTGILYRDI